MTFKMFDFTGWYWIDPDLGNANNAIQVWCDMLSGGETCIHPQANSVGTTNTTE